MDVSTTIKEVERERKISNVVNAYYPSSDVEDPTTMTGISSDAHSRTSKSAMSVVMSVDPKLLNRWASGELESSSDGSAEFVRRKTTLFLGSCCDLLRACIIVDTIYITFISVFLVLLATGYEPAVLILQSTDDAEIYDDDDDGVFDDDDIEFNEEFRMTYIFTDPQAVVQIVGGILFALVGIFGASRFSKYPVLCTAVWYGIHMVLGSLSRMWSDVVVAGLFGYAHVALFVALHKETITRENYNTEKDCCYCCFGQE